MRPMCIYTEATDRRTVFTREEAPWERGLGPRPTVCPCRAQGFGGAWPRVVERSARRLCARLCSVNPPGWVMLAFLPRLPCQPDPKPPLVTTSLPNIVL